MAKSTPSRSMRCVPSAPVHAATGTRSTIVTRRVDGYSHCTRALATRRMLATRSAAAAVSICSSRVPFGMFRAPRTSSWVTTPVPVTTVWRTDISGVKYRMDPRPTAISASSTTNSRVCRP
ncbi:Uncharacterised protein [Mycobacteroides abscessus subsp. abscessus]|nr:Uncharacterised protein [Mycobacteroides abscessus subsp. abscessus]